MTYVFELRNPEVGAGSDQEKELVSGQQKLAKMAVDETLKAMRNLAEAGEL